MKILLIVYDNGSKIHYFPLGTAYIASSLRDAGHDVIIYNQDIHHYPESHLTETLNEGCFDAVGLGFVGNYYTYRKVLKISEAINRSIHRPHYILGGHGPSADPEFFIRKTGADAVVVGEGEIAVHEALRSKGVFRGPPADIDSISWPAYDLFHVDHYRLLSMPHATSEDFVMPFLSARGCIYKCNFCYRMDETYRMRSIPLIVEEIKHLQKEYGITYIDFEDELTMSSVKRATELSLALEPLGIKWACNGRLNFVTPELMKTMKRAGCVFINYGIEAMDDNVLRRMHKHLTVEQIYRGIETTLEAGISPGFNIIFGHIGDTAETLQKGVDFLLAYDDGAQRRTIAPVTPYPGCELFKDAVRDGKLEGTEDFYENKHKNSDLPTVNFTRMSDKEMHLGLWGANKMLLENYYKKQMDFVIHQTKDLYVNRDSNFRGFR